MKTLDQIIRYTSLCSFSTEDWEQVLLYCREKFGGGKMHRAQKIISHSTYTQFIDWVDNDFGSGDIVGYGRTIGVVDYNLPEKTALYAYLGLEGELIQKTIEIYKNKIYKLPEEKIEEFNKILESDGYGICERVGSLIPKYAPNPYTYVAFNISEKEDVYLGILGELSDEKNYHFLALITPDFVRINTKYPKAVINMRKPTGPEIRFFTKSLLKVGFEYMPRTHSLKKVVTRAKRGGKYWYVSDRFTAITACDKYTPTHTQRFESRNYFTSYSSVLCFIQELKNLRNEYEQGRKGQLLDPK